MMPSPYYLPVGLLQTPPPVDLSPYAPRNAPNFTGTVRFDGPVQAATAAVGHGTLGAYDNALFLVPTRHATSRRNTVQFDPGWILCQGSAANGTTDFFLLNRATTRTPVLVGTDDTVPIGGAGNDATAVMQRAAGQVNGSTLKGAATGGDVTIGASGADSVTNIVYSAKGTGVHRFIGAGTEQFRVSAASNAANRLNATGAASGSAPSLSAQGSDTNIPVRVAAQGLGSVTLAQGTIPVFVATANVLNASNFLSTEAREAGIGPVLRANGPDASIDINLRTRGSGVVSFGTVTSCPD
jgi:hypothetical protein